MIKRKYLSYVLTGVVCLLVCGSIMVVWAAAPGSTSVSTDERAVYAGTSETSVALMCNVYSGEQYIPGILDALESAGAGATFFIGGCWAEKHPDEAAEIAERGFETGSHGYLHRDHSVMDYEENVREMRAAHRMIKAVTGKDVELFAPPSGAYCKETLDAAEDMGYKTILWSKDTIDWRDADASLITERALKDVGGGDLILMHPTEKTLAALPGIIRGIKEMSLIPSCVTDAL